MSESRKGPISGLVALIGTGVGVAAEYHEHRKQRRVAASSPLEKPHAVAGPSGQPQTDQHPLPENSPPPYPKHSARQSAADAPVTDKKVTLAHDSDDYDYNSESDSDFSLPIADDEEAWELDELAAANEPPVYEEMPSGNRSNDSLVRDVLVDRKAIEPKLPLALPVILPQRRPCKKSRGFVRAYAPALDDVGIDETTFLKFLKNFHTSSQANPWFDAIMLAAGIAGMTPSVIAMAVCTSVQVVVGIGKEIDSRKNTNKFLDRMNEQLFKPAGCFALIVRYKPDADVANAGSGLFSCFGVGSEKVDFSSLKAVAKYDNPSGAQEGAKGLVASLRKIRLVSGETRGSVQMSEAAPLIYPEIDSVMHSGKDGNETFKDKTKDARKFLASYADQRAHIAYARDNPSSTLTVPENKRQMRSKWADQEHPMFNNGLVGLLSGGRMDLSDSKGERQACGQGRGVGHFKEKLEGRGTRFGSRVGKTSAKNGGVISAVRKVMEEDVLYLMIVPMPPEWELAKAREMITREKVIGK
jgi:hypothetical protein